MMLRSALSASAAGGIHRPWAARFGRIARLQSQERVTNRINSTEHAARNVADAPKVSCGRLPPKSWPELRIRNAAARPRIVSGGWLWPGRRELSCYFKYMARGRISEFESYHPSHAVVSFAVKRRPVGHEALGFNVRHYVPIRAAPKGAQSAPMLTFIEENAQAGVFLPEDVRILVAAFDDAWARLLRLRTSPCSAILCVRNRACSLVLGSLEQMELDETGDSRSIGMPGRNQSESVVAITRCAHAYQISPMFGYLPNIFLCRITRQTKVLKSSERDVLCRRCHYQCLAPPCHGSRIGAQ
jgi:hypothetical protein